MLKVAMSAPLSVLDVGYVPTLDEAQARVKSAPAGCPNPRHRPNGTSPDARRRHSQVCDLSCVTARADLASFVPLMAHMNDARHDRQSQEGREMMTRKNVGAVMAGLVLSTALLTGAFARGQDPTMPQGPTVPWTENIKAMNKALRFGDVARAQAQWRDASGAPLGSRR